MSLNLGAESLLQREELKKVIGGYMPGGNCFQDAINELEEMESDLGFVLNDYGAAEWLNLNYATCVCMERYQSIASVALYDACWGGY